jgi:radical SAM protein with 4Fe4S-binding SPASM domain
MTINRVADYRFTSHGWERGQTGPSQRIRTYKGAYISITSLCNTDVCSYCYARDQKTHTQRMPLELFANILNMLADVSDFPEVYLVGGEPTTMRQLPQYLDEIGQHGWSTTIYTNGGFNSKQMEALRASPAVTRVVFHYDELLFRTFKWLRARWDANLRALSATCEISITAVIDGPDFPFIDLVDLAASYGATFTWIFATPTSGSTPYVDLTGMRALGPQVQRMLLHALDRGVTTSPDLPIPLCIFDARFLAEYAEQFALVRRCQPFAYFHVDGRVSYCTAMPIYTAPRPTTSSQLADVIERHREQDRVLKLRTSFPECESCEHHLRQTCQGGCMTYKVYGGTSGNYERPIDPIRPVATRNKATTE